MKRLLTLAMSGFVAVALLGCHASVEPADSGSSHSEKTTTYNPDGTKTTKTETKTEKSY
jgi:hypothetical protein